MEFHQCFATVKVATVSAVISAYSEPMWLPSSVNIYMYSVYRVCTYYDSSANAYVSDNMYIAVRVLHLSAFILCSFCTSALGPVAQR